MTNAIHSLHVTAALAACSVALMSACELSESTAELGIYEQQRASASSEPPAATGDARDATPPACASAGADTEAVGSCISPTPLEYDDPKLSCHVLAAHAAEDVSEPYAIPASGRHEARFEFAAPWSGVAYLRSLAGSTDNRGSVHHMALYQNRKGGGNGASADSRLLHYWAPGDTDLHLAPELGLRLDANTDYTLVVTYSPGTPAPGLDRSGFELCVTSTKPSHEVSFSRIGTESLAGSSATGTCTPAGTDPIYLLAARPELGVEGRHVQLTVLRPDGAEESVLDAPYDAEAQQLSTLSQTVQAGDALTTTCSFGSPVSFPEHRCYVNVLHWPARALVGEGAQPNERDSCLDRDAI